MELEAEEPSHGAFPALGDSFENLVDMNPLVLTHTQRRAVHEADARAFAQQHLLDEDCQWNSHGALQFYEAVIGNNTWEEVTEVLADMLHIEMLKAAVA